MSKPVTRRDPLIFGRIFVAVGIGVMAMMTVSPAGLNVPYWVALTAAATFVFAGASVVAQGLGWRVAGRLLALITVLCLATPGLWILLDPAEKHCTAGVGAFGGSVTTGAGDFMCRTVFGVGGAITLAVGVVALLAFIRYVRRRSKAGEESSATDTLAD